MHPNMWMRCYGPLARNRPSDPSVSAVSQSPKQATGTQSPKTMSEADAIRLAQAGDAAAFEFLYRLHGRRVYALCLRMVVIRAMRKT